jgi:uncharacterized integral membrane protein (TIGR00697 family)
MFLDLAFVMLCFKLGKDFLYMAVIANIMFTNMVSSKITVVFGLDSTVANVFYASIFLATDLLGEHYGKKYALKTVWLGFLSLIPIIIFAPFVGMFPPVSYSKDIHESLVTIFGQVDRIVIASLIAYICANLFDVWWFDKIKAKFPQKKWLWLRNNGSTMLSQLIDNSIFVLLAFAVAVPNSALWQIFLSGYIIKVVIAFCDTPFIYLSYYIKPKPKISE